MTNPPESVPASVAPSGSGPAYPPHDSLTRPAQRAPEKSASDPSVDPPSAPVSPASAADPFAGPAPVPVPSVGPPPAPSFGLPPTVPAPPTYDPSLLMQAMPVSGQYLPPPAPTPQNGAKTSAVVLSMLLGLFVLASATLGVLYVQQGQESTRESEEIASLEAEIESVQRQLSAAERDLRGADQDLADARTERDAITDCLTAIYDWWDALDETGGVDTAATDAVWLEASRLCQEADQYL
jgi:hypothetical protein